MMKNKGLIIFGISIALLAGIFIGSQLNFSYTYKLFPESNAEMKLRRIIHSIEKDYVEEVNMDSILEVVTQKVFGQLDPHSTYISKEEMQQIKEEMEGHFRGIGIRFHMYHDTVTIADIIPGGPAEKAGLKAGDRILTINSDTVYGKFYTPQNIADIIKKYASAQIKLSVCSLSGKHLREVLVEPGNVNLTSVPVSVMLDSVTGYIRIQRFAKNTADEFHSALLKLKQQGMKILALDLRGNSGGYLDMADRVADEFLPEGKLIYSTKSKNKEAVETYATGEGEFETGKLFVLVDENSASASELVAGALQDQDRATIIGRRTYGKGLVQQEINLGDGSAIRITTAKYYTPTGRCIQKPYTKGHKDLYMYEGVTRLYNGELYNKDSIHVNDSLRFTTPQGKTVYGGGGIVPDVFVPKEYSEYHSVIIPGFEDFTFRYIDSHREELSRISAKEFPEYYEKTGICNEFFKKNNEEPTELMTQYVCRSLIEYFIRQLYGMDAYYRLRLPEDPMIKKMYSLMETKKPYEKDEK